MHIKVLCLLLLFTFSITSNSAGVPSESDIISHAKAISVNTLDPELADQPFEAWLNKTIGPDWTILWKADRCGLLGIHLDADTGNDTCVTVICHEYVRDGLGINQPEHHELGIKLIIADKHRTYLAQPHLYHVSFYRFGGISRFNSENHGEDTEALFTLSRVAPTLIAHQEQDRARINNTRQNRSNSSRREFMEWLILISSMIVIIVVTGSSFAAQADKIELSLIGVAEAKRSFFISSARAYGMSIVALFIVNFAERLIGGEWLFAGEAGLGAIVQLFFDFTVCIVVFLLGRSH